MLADLRTHAKLREFFHLWLRLDPAPDVAKDAERFPGFDPAVVADLRTSLDLFAGGRGLERRFGLPQAAARGRSLSQRPAGEVLRRRPARRRAASRR